MRTILLGIAGIAATFVAGCADQTAHLIVDAPNHGIVPGPEFDPPEALLQATGVSRQFRVNVGPPDASLYVRVIDPPAGVSPRGTVVVLHGFLASGDLMMGQARPIAAAGYRAVVVDLRGHGRSTGKYISFGVHESADLAQVLDDLAARKLVAERVGVLGMSYGAATAVQWAGRDPRVAAVVAMAPFATMRDEVPAYGRTFAPGVGWKSDAEYTELLAAAGRLTGFDPAEASPLAAIAKTKAPVLLVHGSADAVIAASHSERLHAAAKDHSQLVLVPGGGHASVWMDIDETVRKRTLAWFETHLATPAANGAGAKKN